MLVKHLQIVLIISKWHRNCKLFKHGGACYARINMDVGVHSLCTGYVNVYVMAALTKYIILCLCLSSSC